MRHFSFALGILLTLVACRTAPASTSTPSASPSAMATVSLQPTPTAQPWPTQFVPVPDSTVTREKGDSVIVVPGVEGEVRLDRPANNPWDLAQYQPAGESAHFLFYSRDGTTPLPLAELQSEAEAIYDQVSARVGVGFDGLIPIYFSPPQEVACPVRGIASASGPDGKDKPFILVFADEDTSRQQVLGVFAHEVAHILHYQTPEGASASAALTEGFAHWAAARFVNAWYGSSSFDEQIRGYLADGSYRPLTEIYEFRAQPHPDDPDDCLAKRDQIYSEWAAFIGFLIEQYGRADFNELMTSHEVNSTNGGYTLRPADFEGIYGLSLNQLEARWLNQLVSSG